MAKKIAVLAGDRQEEALRMSIGLILFDDIIDVYLLDRKLNENDKNTLNLETMRDMDMKVYTNFEQNEGIELLSDSDIAERLTDYDHIIYY